MYNLVLLLFFAPTVSPLYAHAMKIHVTCTVLIEKKVLADICVCVGVFTDKLHCTYYTSLGFSL